MYDWTITTEERTYLRELAKKQLEYSMLPIMKEREKLWYDHNDLKGKCPLIHFEIWTFEDDILPELKCTSRAARNIELVINRNIANHEYVDDDRVVPSWFPVSWGINFKLFDLDIERQHAKDAEGRDLGYHTLYPVTDLEKDMHLFKDTIFSVNREGALKWKAFVEETIGDILPVKMVPGYLGVCLTQNIINLMGMETMMYSMIDYPDEFHAVMRRMTDDYIRYMRWLEDEKLLILNNTNVVVNQGSFGFTNDLPGENFDPDNITMKNIWGYMDSQETVSVSPDMYGEFFAPYYAEVAKNFGLLNYGCCEPVNPVWDKYVSKFNGLRKVSISPWCDEEYMGNVLKGSNVIYHRKPSPNFVGVGKDLNEEEFAKHIQKTLISAKGCKLEFSFRDVYTLSGNKTKPRRAVEIVREQIEKHWE